MGIIRQMSPALARLIAAGEVVQGPFSVIKELVDNALDAGADTIDVVIEQGGLRSIRVADNGQGMDREDAQLCLSQHATSKVYTEEDLNRIMTMGFRGEALAAIAGVSRLKIDTMRDSDAEGTSVFAVGGEVRECKSAARRRGTTLEVSNLFFNVPATLASAGSARAEAGRVYRTLVHLAIARPDVRFTLHSDGRELLQTSPTADRLERIRQIYGSEFTDQLIPIASERGEVRVEGYVTRPDVATRRTTKTTFLVNQRPFQSYILKRVIANAFQGRIPNGTYPEAVLHIEVPPTDVDVNVTPDKSDVKFRHAGRVWAAVTDALNQSLGAREAIPELKSRGSQEEGEDQGRTNPEPIRGLPSWTAQGGRLSSTDRTDLPEESSRLPLDLHGSPQHALSTSEPHPREEASTTPPASERRHGIPEHPVVLMQVSTTFIACPTHEGMLLIDQHSAHERILYERLRSRYIGGGKSHDVQMLMFPVTLEVDTQEMLLLEEMMPYLEKMGFELSQAGPKEVWIQATPASLGNQSPLDTLRALMEVYQSQRDKGLSEAEIQEGLTPMEERMLKTMACRMAIKSGDVLSEERMRSLWKDLVRVDLAAHDVHGRPGAVILTEDEIRRRLGRSSLL